MKDEWCVVNDLCPHGYLEVVVAKCLPSGALVGFCSCCYAAWLWPDDVKDFNDDYVICVDHAPDGICCPGPDEVAASPWGPCVLLRLPASQYTALSEINESLYRDRANRTE